MNGWKRGRRVRWLGIAVGGVVLALAVSFDGKGRRTSGDAKWTPRVVTRH